MNEILENEYIGALLSFLLGAIIGVERQFLAIKDEERRKPGVRTFGLTSLLAYLSVHLYVNGAWWAIVIGISSFLILLGFYSFVKYSLFREPGVTTSVAFALTFFIGALVALNQAFFAVAITVFVVFILTIKQRIETILTSLRYEEIRSAIEIGLLFFFLWPIVPSVTDPIFHVVNLQIFYLFLVLVLSLSFAAYVAVRILGLKRGIITFTIIGSFAHSEATSVNIISFFKDKSTELTSKSRIFLSSTIILANSTMILRTLILVGILAWNTTLLLPLFEILLPTAMIGMLISLLISRKTPEIPEIREKIILENPLKWGSAIKFTATFAGVVFFIVAIQQTIPNVGFILACTIGGFVSNLGVALSAITLFTSGIISDRLAIMGIIAGTASAVGNKIFWTKLAGASGKLLLSIAVSVILLITLLLVFSLIVI